MIPLFPELVFKLPSILNLLLALLLAACLLFSQQLPVWARFLFYPILFLLILEDGTRLQPWIWQYAFIYAALQFNRPLPLLIIILGGTYCWAGIHKLFPLFSEQYMQHYFGIKPPLSLFPGLYEFGAGLLLLIPGTRKLGYYLAIALHLGFLLLVWPLSGFENGVIIPWNIVLLVLLGFLLKETPSVQPDNWMPQSILYLLFVLLPGLNLVEHWDSRISAAIYSGRQAQSTLIISEPLPPLPASLLHSRLGQGFSPEQWALEDLHVGFYGSPSRYQQLLESLCEQYHLPPGTKLYYLIGYPRKANVIACSGSRSPE